jgi:hypothetical protein
MGEILIMKTTTCLFLCLIISLALSRCVPIRPEIPPAQTQTEPSLPISTPTLCPTPISIPTPLATLEPKQAEETMGRLLREPIDCGAPCFWGIAPRSTTLGEAKAVFAHLGLQMKYTNTLDGKAFYQVTHDFDSGLSISLLMAIQDNIVTDGRIFITPEKQRAGISREWLAYSPETLIKRYGTPSRVDFSIDFGGAHSSFSMFIYFDRLDLIVEYAGIDAIDQRGGIPRVCPLTDQYDAVRLWMGKDPQYPPVDGVPLEQATSMTIANFSALMTGDPDSACFNLNAEMFR